MSSQPLKTVIAEINGGNDITSMRPVFDQNDQHIIVGSDRQIIYYNLNSLHISAKAYIKSADMQADEVIVNCHRQGNTLIVCTNYAKIFSWDLDTRCWLNEIYLPAKGSRTVKSFKILGEGHYIYTLLDNMTDKIAIFSAVAKTLRGRPKIRSMIGECSDGTEISFDIGPLSGTSSSEHKTEQSLLVYMCRNFLYFHQVIIDEKITNFKLEYSTKDIDFTCVRCNPIVPMVAGGDALGRVYLYSGNFLDKKVQRTNLHWHSLAVSDLCFSSTGKTLFSVGGEAGCVVVWDLSMNNLGQKRIIARLGMPIRLMTCGNELNQLALSFEDNEIQVLDTNTEQRILPTLTRKTTDIFLKNDFKALRRPFPKVKYYVPSSLTSEPSSSTIGLVWCSYNDTVMTNSRTGYLQFYSPSSRSKISHLNILKNHIMTIDRDISVIPSDITKASVTSQGDWLACYETRTVKDTFPIIKLHLWQLTRTNNRWSWVQTIDRLHDDSSIADLKFSPDGRFLISLSEDGSFQILHRVNLDSKVDDLSRAKLMYVKGFSGNAPRGLATMAAFSQDSSVMAISLKNGTTLIWMIEDPYKLVYECQLNQLEFDEDSKMVNKTNDIDQKVLGLHFGHHRETERVAPICEVRATTIRVWNVLNPQENARYSVLDHSVSLPAKCDKSKIRLTAAAFDQTLNQQQDNFLAVTNNYDQVLLFKLTLGRGSSEPLRPLITACASLPIHRNPPTIYTHMCFMEKPVSHIDEDRCEMVKLLNRLCLFNSREEIVSFVDKLTHDSASCNKIKTNELNEYFNQSMTNEEEPIPVPDLTKEQARLRKRREIQKILRSLERIPAHNLPEMQVLGPIILDKVVNKL